MWRNSAWIAAATDGEGPNAFSFRLRRRTPASSSAGKARADGASRVVARASPEVWRSERRDSCEVMVRPCMFSLQVSVHRVEKDCETAVRTRERGIRGRFGGI